MTEQINTPEEVRVQQLQLLSSAVEYAPKAIAELKKVAGEFYGVKQDDSDEYLDFVLENGNWLIQAMNATLDLINEQRIVIDVAQANQSVLDLNDALASKVDAKIADVLEKEYIPLLEQFVEAASEYIS